ncbi:STAGA complex 65 subunit gamma [Sturnira hondurensis]|uniref:STAGA complex 65 subunit gamma n=1 Tax=Sturnira hondurensis TaxID=192404 RepID=UPI001879B7DF|nr:STAGA complex 65 subunit gamma [Sturnira hondurensis]XP_036922571.1 STAGA complex 65 subunit gamma [Sturnira hondurensis]XP_036922572.1 STAGA complex 65 subunit gamma [Sturnira hondurensis]XP_036922573.1 STAGA complex 65 subunit gamma [Sturnira hondurensis]
MLRYWGEIPISSSQTNRSSFDLLPREFRLVEVHDPPLHQPSANKPKPPTMLDVPSEPCSLTIHTIQLIQHNRRLRNLIATAQAQNQQQTEGIKTEEGEPLPSCPGSPPLPDDLLPLDCKNPSAPFQIRHSDPESDFYRGKGEPVTELSWHSCRQLLYQAVATILAHAGFECANESVLETLTDVAHEYCLKFTKLLRFAVDREALLGQTPFPDVMEQVFHEVGIGSVLSLQKFWQHRIKDYHSYMLQISKQLSEEYERIVNPEKATEDTKPVKIKEEPVSDIPFPVSEELEADLAPGDQSLPMGVLGAQSERFPSNLEVEASPQASSTEVNASPLWNLAHVKMEPQESEEGNVTGHGVLGSDVFEEPMSGMSEAGIPQSPEDSDSSYGSHSTDSLMGSSPVFNQRCKKRMRKI